MGVNYGISFPFKLKGWDLNPSGTGEETNSLLQPPAFTPLAPPPLPVLRAGRCQGWEEGRRTKGSEVTRGCQEAEVWAWAICLPCIYLVLSSNSYLTWNRQLAFCWKEPPSSAGTAISNKGASQE